MCGVCVATSSFVLRSASTFAHWCKWTRADVICLLIRCHAEGALSEVLRQKKDRSRRASNGGPVCVKCLQSSHFLSLYVSFGMIPTGETSVSPATLHSLLSHSLTSCCYNLSIFFVDKVLVSPLDVLKPSPSDLSGFASIISDILQRFSFLVHPDPRLIIVVTAASNPTSSVPVLETFWPLETF